MLSIFGSSSLLRPLALRSMASFSSPATYTRLAGIVHCRRQMSMQFSNPRNSILDPNVEWANMSKETTKSEQLPANPYSGRSVRVFNGNLADAFKKLDRILGRNRVRAQVRLDERHEQKGAKRRRLSSERWRKRFAHEVRLKVQLVQKIRRRGA